MPGRKEYQYIEAVLFQPALPDTATATTRLARRSAERQVGAPPKLDDLRRAPWSSSCRWSRRTRTIHRNRAILISTALVTAILAMVASYVIVRYVIVKPVKHLRDVSDAIAAGKLNIRSQIQTGDEFEELSHAFNRMLHNLVAMQQELREVNGDLDRRSTSWPRRTWPCSR